MKIKINSFNDFVSFCQMIKCLEELSENCHDYLTFTTLNLIEDLNNSFVEALAQNSDFSDFYKKNNFNLIDLDLLQISLFERTIVITPELYLDKSIFKLFDGMTVFQLLPKLRSAEIIKRNILFLDDHFAIDPYFNNLEYCYLPLKFELDSIKTSSNSININDGFEIDFDITPFKNFDDFVLDLKLYDEFISNISLLKNFRKQELGLFKNMLLKRLMDRFDFTLKHDKNDFSKFLLKNNIVFEELVFICKIIYDTHPLGLDFHGFKISDNLINKLIKDQQKIVNFLLKKDLIYFKDNVLNLSKEVNITLIGYKTE